MKSKLKSATFKWGSEHQHHQRPQARGLHQPRAAERHIGRVLRWDARNCDRDVECTATFIFHNTSKVDPAKAVDQGNISHMDVATGHCSTKLIEMGCTEIYDLTSQHIYGGAFFHRIADVLMPAFGVLDTLALERGNASESANGVDATKATLLEHSRRAHGKACVLVPDERNNFWTETVYAVFLAPRGVSRSDYTTIRQPMDRKASRQPMGRLRTAHDAERLEGAARRQECYHLTPIIAHVTTWDGMLQLKSRQFASRGGCGRDERANIARVTNAFRVAAALQPLPLVGRPSRRTGPRVLLLRRGPTLSRHLHDFAAFQRYFEGRYGGVAVYYGNESLLETFSLFSTSDVVIGFHGAGAVNIMFSPAHSLTVEIQSMDWDDGQSGRFVGCQCSSGTECTRPRPGSAHNASCPVSDIDACADVVIRPASPRDSSRTTQTLRSEDACHGCRHPEVTDDPDFTDVHGRHCSDYRRPGFFENTWKHDFYKTLNLTRAEMQEVQQRCLHTFQCTHVAPWQGFSNKAVASCSEGARWKRYILPWSQVLDQSKGSIGANALLGHNFGQMAWADIVLTKWDLGQMAAMIDRLWKAPLR